MRIDSCWNWRSSCRCARCGAQQGHHSSRHQAREYFCDRARSGEDARFRTGESEAGGERRARDDFATCGRPRAGQGSESDESGHRARTRWRICRPSRCAARSWTARTDLFSLWHCAFTKWRRAASVLGRHFRRDFSTRFWSANRRRRRRGWIPTCPLNSSA